MDTAKPYSAKVPVICALLALLGVAATFFMPISVHSVNSAAVHWRAAASTAPAILLFGAAIIFLRDMKMFKESVRSAYKLFAFAMLAFSILLGQITVWGLFDLWNSAWATSGAGLVPLAINTIALYLGARKFAKLLQVNTLFNNVLLVGVLTLCTGVAMGIFAHYFVRYHIDGTDIYIGVCAFGGASLGCGALLMAKVARVVSVVYRQALRWMALSIGCFSAASWHESINTLWFNNGSTYTDWGYYLIPWTVVGLVVLYASYRLGTVGLYGANVGAGAAEAATDDDYIDSIVAVAGLASRPENVDAILDDLRAITANLEPGQTLDSAARQRLLGTYSRLETYLSQHDPLRSIGKEEVLSHVTPAFRALVEHKTTNN